MEQHKQPSVWVIVLNWNGREHLDSCLSSLEAQRYANRQFLLVDNASDDDSVAYVQRRFPAVRILQSRANVGFAAGNNLGIRLAMEQGADYVVLLNNDTEVEPDWLGALVRTAESDPRIGALGSRVLFFDRRDTLNSVGHEMNHLGRVWDMAFGAPANGRHLEPAEILGACGAAMFLRRTALDETGLFDEGYFAYSEDVDLSVRIRARGYSIRYEPAALVYHKFGGSAAGIGEAKQRLQERNQYRFLLRNLPGDLLIRLLPRRLYADLRESLGDLRHGKPARLIRYLGNWLRLLLETPRLLVQRRALAHKARDRAFWKMITRNASPPEFPPLGG